MATQREFRVLVATDGSRDAQAAVATTMHFPWPARTRVRAISARRTGASYRKSILLTALDRGAEQATERARRALVGRWPEVEGEVVDKTPAAGILDEAERLRADVIVVGWRGHGAVRRLLMGSVSREVVRGATSAVLVVRRSQHVSKIVVGVDGSSAAKRALALLGRLVPPPGGHVTLVSSVELMTALPGSRVPGAAAIAREIKRHNLTRTRTAKAALTRAAAELKRRGWRTRTVLVHGEPLRALLDEVATARAQMLVVGSRGTSGVRRLLLGSVADGALNRCPVAVLIAR